MSKLSFEIILKGPNRRRHWEFDEPQARNDLFNKVRGYFSNLEYKNKNEAISKGVSQVIQLTSEDNRIDSNEKLADIMPTAWYNVKHIDEIIKYIDKEY